MPVELFEAQLPPPRNPNRGLAIAAIPVVVFVLVAIVGPMLVPYDSVHVNTGDRLLPPLSTLESGATAWFGTDSVGRDVLAQILVGARVSLIVGAATVALAGLVGTFVGLIAGYFGGWLDGIVMRLADIQLSLPSFLMAILIAGALGPSITNVVVTLALTRWVVFARVVRSTTLSVRTREYVDSARVIGVPTSRLLFRHILPAALTPLLIVATVQFGLVILAEASLSFLGLGTPDSQPSWGLIIANGRDYLSSAWWIAAIPGVFLSSVVVSMGILGDRLRDALDPQLALQ
jgi:peptide/nickel transport system permease protein